MKNNATVTFWSADALLTLVGTDVYKVLTPELISRLSAFVDAYILFDKICLPERYTTYKELSMLGDEAFKYIPSDDLRHSDDMRKGVTIDLNIASLAYSKIVDKDRYWFMQHDPNWSEAYDIIPDMADEKFFSKIRLWLWCLTNEVSEKYDAVALIPNSLHEIEKIESDRFKANDLILDLFKEFTVHFSERLIAASRYVEDPYLDTIKYFPPFLSVLLDRSNDKEAIVDNLKQMRADYKELRLLRSKFVNYIAKAKSVGEKRDIVESWNASWKNLLKNDFKKSGFLSKKISSGDIVKIVYDFANIQNIFKFLTQRTLDYCFEAKASKHFKIFTKISKDTDGVYFNNADMYRKFGIEKIIES